MLASSFLWILLAVVLFWAVGAYNRLVRLRSAAIQAFGGLDVHLVRMQALPAGCSAMAGLKGVEEASAWQSLQAAATQFGALLAAARAQPLQADSAAVLSTALMALCAAADAVLQSGTEEAVRPEATWIQQWDSLQAQRQVAQAQFNQSVVQYNEALAQFPARLLAGLSGFKPGHTL